MGSKKKGSKSAKGPKKKKSAGARGSARSKSSTKDDGEIDMLNRHAMENLYYIAHGPVDALELRGFGWTGSDGGKGGGKKKGKKGKKKK